MTPGMFVPGQRHPLHQPFAALGSTHTVPMSESGTRRWRLNAQSLLQPRTSTTRSPCWINKSTIALVSFRRLCIRVATSIPSQADALSDRVVGSQQERWRDRHAERRRGLFVLPFPRCLLGDLDVGGGGVEAFRTSSTTSCHQCSEGELSSPSRRWRVSVNCASWCHASQFLRVL